MEVMYDMLIQGDGKELFYQPLGGYQSYSLDAQKRITRAPQCIIWS